MASPFALLRDALWLLSLEPAEQRRELEGTVVTDELALDLDNAVRSLRHAQRAANVELPDEVIAGVRQLSGLLDAPAHDDLWADEALDRHRAWADARRIARSLLPLLPSE